ncbi:g-type lectin s-receptor-like serine/threonine-protein kinase [Quercus suber]|uniref:non-specific serine/threonine protein kinase n=1 Tax=Quercus suber TaxID=58331 RepID=A0AAW0KIK4_QUESU
MPAEKLPMDGSEGLFHDVRCTFSSFLKLELIYDKEETVYATVVYLNVSGLSKHLVDSQGNSMQINWDDEKEDWEVVGFAPANECDVYGTCGAFGNCYALSSPICSCLKGFEPKIVEEWNRGNMEGGGKEDRFLKLEMIKVPDFAESSYRTKDDCRKQCLEKCSCVAYAYDTGMVVCHGVET